MKCLPLWIMCVLGVQCKFTDAQSFEDFVGQPQHQQQPTSGPRLQPLTIHPTAVGSNLTVVCALIPGYSPVKFRWFHRGRPLRDDSSRLNVRQLADLSVLQISQLEETDAGNYECEVEDERGARDRKQASLEVQIPPRWADGMLPPAVKDLLLNDVSDISCDATGFPFPEVVWLHLGSDGRWSEQLPPYADTIESGRLRIQAALGLNRTVFACLVKNDLGSIQSQIRIIIRARVRTGRHGH